MLLLRPYAHGETAILRFSVHLEDAKKEERIHANAHIMLSAKTVATLIVAALSTPVDLAEPADRQ